MERLHIDGILQQQATRSVRLGEIDGNSVVVKDNTNTVRFRRELSIYKSLMSSKKGDGVLPFPKLLYADEKQQRLVLEYINGQPLSHSIDSSDGLPEENMKYAAATNFLEAVSYFHDKGIAHLDLHPGNILYNKQDNRLVLVDFDVAILGNPSLESVSNNYPRPLFTRETFYIPQVPSIIVHSPELLQEGTINAVASDMYTVSSTLIQIMWGIKPLVDAAKNNPQALDLPLLEQSIRTSSHFSVEQETLLGQILSNLVLNPEERKITPTQLIRSLDQLSGQSKSTQPSIDFPPTRRLQQ